MLLYVGHALEEQVFKATTLNGPANETIWFFNKSGCKGGEPALL